MKDLDHQSKTIFLKDYTAPDYVVDTVELTFELGEDLTRVVSVLQLKRNTSANAPLELDGEQLELGAVRIDGRQLDTTDYVVTDTSLMIPQVSDSFCLEIETFIKPQENLSLEGLYKSSGNFCTQCEAEGFRKITYYPDRPDVMAIFTTTIIADKALYPVLLSNGNPVESGNFDDAGDDTGGDSRHWVRWHDPHRKPCYLFALVAGDLAFIEDSYTTMSGKDVLCRIYVQAHNIDQCDFALASLKKSMQWDEQTYGREYDLDVYNIVAVDDFNMGAMENKGLNVFNSKYVLARPETATDTDFINIEGVIGHEYFHNWSGNRVTCRDWFQLTLKEGLTVFRDQQFTADMNSAAPKRIDDVNILRTAQFAEDRGPMAHPIQPASYQEINNFYTVTVYNKGAEVIRMIHTLLGKAGFRAGMDLYFERHDGQAVTTEAFVTAMEDASGVDLSQFRLWYSQAGTPHITVEEAYDASTGRYQLELSQHTAATPGQDSKQPFHIPVRVALLDEKGESMSFTVDGDHSGIGSDEYSAVLNLKQQQQTYSFEGIPEKPVISILQGYSAPVALEFERSDEELAFCMAHENDEFNRWEAGQQLSTRLIIDMVARVNASMPLELPDFYIDACRKTLNDTATDKALIARALTLPSLSYIGEQMEVIDVDAIHAAREFIHQHLACSLAEDFSRVYESNRQEYYHLNPQAMAERFLKNQALAYLMYTPEQGQQLSREQYDAAGNMTDQMAAFRCLVHHETAVADDIIERFYQQWKDDNLVIDKWFTVQATVPHESAKQRVLTLFEHKDFDIRNPNRLRSLLGAYCSANPICFHSQDGTGYRLLGQYIEDLDSINPQIASRLCVPLTRWRRYNELRQQMMRSELQRLSALQGLSRDVSELVEKSLA